jgi:hypothetical protein
VFVLSLTLQLLLVLPKVLYGVHADSSLTIQESSACNIYIYAPSVAVMCIHTFKCASADQYQYKRQTHDATH